jgi:hypothetical protein
MSLTALRSEPDLLTVYLCAIEGLTQGESRPEVPDLRDVTLQLLQNAQVESRSQAVGSYFVRRTPQLAWDASAKVFGSDEVLVKRIDDLLASEAAIDPALRELAPR